MKGPCDNCGSTDGRHDYGDHTYCFVCKTRTEDMETTKAQPAQRRSGNKLALVQDLRILELASRGISAETCKKYGYGCKMVPGFYFGQREDLPVQVAPYTDKYGSVVAQKIRRVTEKDFRFAGDSGEATLFGQHLFPPGGKHLTVLEGEIDALSMSQLFQNRWPAVSVPNGAGGAADSIRANLEYVESFDRVVFMFDDDGPGREAALACAQLLTPGKAAIATPPCKDVNEALVQGKGEQVLRAFWDATPFRPDGLMSGAALFERVISEPKPEFIQWPWAGLQQMTRGMKKGSIVTVAGGPASGKTVACNELASHWAAEGYRVGIISLEQDGRETLMGLLTTRVDLPLHLDPGVDLEQYADIWEPLGEKLTIYDHQGTLDADNMYAKARFMAKADQCDVIFVDNLSVIVTSSKTSNERRLIDEIMQKFVSVKGETGTTIINVVHLKRPSEGLGWEQGRETTLGDLRGSGMIEAFSHTVIGVERDQAGDHSGTAVVRLLKCRHTGLAGEADRLTYNRETGRLEWKNDFDTV